MKRTITLFMALALVTSLFAMPHNPKQFILGKQTVQIRKAAMTEGTTTTYTFSSFTSSDKVELSSQNFNITLTKGTQNQPAWNDNSSQARMYVGSSMIISSTNNITKVEYNYVVNANKNGKTPTIDGVTGSKVDGTWDETTKTWTGSDTKVTMSIGGDAGNLGFTSVTVTTDGQGGGGGGDEGDTTKIEDVDGLEIDYYPSYSEEGAYDYTFLLYNSEDEDYLPMVAFDVLTAAEGSYTGTYTMQGGTLTDYSYYVYGTGDDDYMEFTDGEVTITDNGNGNYTIKGWFTDGTKVYLVDKTLDGEYFNADYPYEPEEKTTLNLVITDGEEDNSYTEEYGVIDLYLTTADGELTLEYVMQSTETSTTIPDGTYPIEASEYDEDDYIVDKGYSYFEAGSYYSSYGMAVGSTYQTEEEIYYLVSGTVKVETVEDGKKVTLTGTTYYGSTITAEYIISGSTALRDAAANMKVNGKYMMNGQFVILKNNVLYNAQGQEIK